jgi:hypothetical protein
MCRISKQDKKDGFCGRNEKYTKALGRKSELKDHLDNIGINKLILKWIENRNSLRYGLNCSLLGCDSVAGVCEHNNGQPSQ